MTNHNIDQTKSILDLTIEELEGVLQTNQLPDGVSLLGISERKDFDKLFRHRQNPKYIAQILLRERLKTRILAETPEVKSERSALKQAELELRRKRLENQTQMQGNIYKRLQAIEDAVTLIIRGIANTNEKLDILLEANESTTR